MTDRHLRAAVAALALLGVAIAGYLTVAHFADVRIACPTGGCETVQSSRYSELLGIPVALLGLGAYLVVLATAASAREAARALGAAVAVGGAVFALYLVYVQAVVLEAFCLWCLANDAVIVLLAVAAALRLRSAGQP